MKHVWIILFLSMNAFAHPGYELQEGQYQVSDLSEFLFVPQFELEYVGGGNYMLKNSCVRYGGGHGCVSFDPVILSYDPSISAYSSTEAFRLVFHYQNTSATCTTNNNRIRLHQNDKGETFVEVRLSGGPKHYSNSGCRFSNNYSWHTQGQALSLIED